MEPMGHIKRTEGEAIDIDEWILFIKQTDFLEQMEDQKGINPFTYEPVVFERPFAAYVIDNGEKAGSMVLEGDIIQVDALNSEVMAKYAGAVSKKLGAEFIPG